jgi:hypothetical protein
VDSYLKLLNSNISYNKATLWEGDGIYTYIFNIDIVNTIFWNNFGDQIYTQLFMPDGMTDSIMVTNSVIQGGTETGIIQHAALNLNYLDSNIEENPQFVDPYSNDFSLGENSPCIDAGTDYFVWGGDTLVNMTPDEYMGVAPDIGTIESPYTVSINDDLPIPEKIALYQNYPNPFNPVTTIKFDIPVETTGSVVSSRRSTVTCLHIFDVKGRLVETLIDGAMESGSHSVIWNASDVASGVYIYRIMARQKDDGKARDFTQTRKMVLLK